MKNKKKPNLVKFCAIPEKEEIKQDNLDTHYEKLLANEDLITNKPIVKEIENQSTTELLKQIDTLKHTNASLLNHNKYCNNKRDLLLIEINEKTEYIWNLEKRLKESENAKSRLENKLSGSEHDLRLAILHLSLEKDKTICLKEELNQIESKNFIQRLFNL